MKYTQIPANAFKNIQLNAGILVDSFIPATGVVGNLIGATSGGVSFNDTPEYKDFGDDIDNCPKNMKELKKLQKHEVKMTGTFVTISAQTAKRLAGSADIDNNDNTHIVPRNDIIDADFADVWWIGDYSDENTGDNAGYVAIHLINALNTGGFQIQTTDREKGKFAFEFTGHYSMSAQDTVPYEIYVKQGGTTVNPSVLLDTHAISVDVLGSVVLSATVYPEGTEVAWTSSDNETASVSDGVVTGVAAGSAIITATITVDEVDYTDTCTVIVNAAPAP